VIADGPSPGRWTGLAGMAEGLRDWLSAWEGFRSKASEYRPRAHALVAAIDRFGAHLDEPRHAAQIPLDVGVVDLKRPRVVARHIRLLQSPHKLNLLSRHGSGSIALRSALHVLCTSRGPQTSAVVGLRQRAAR
jgi:hypothetical protein